MTPEERAQQLDIELRTRNGPEIYWQTLRIRLELMTAAFRGAEAVARRKEREAIASLFDHDGWLDLTRNGTLPNDVITPRTVAQVIRSLPDSPETE